MNITCKGLFMPMPIPDLWNKNKLTFNFINIFLVLSPVNFKEIV